MAEHCKGRHAVERSNSKSTRRRQSSDSPADASATGVQEQLAALASKHERDVTSLLRISYAFKQQQQQQLIADPPPSHHRGDLCDFHKSDKAHPYCLLLI